MSAWLFALAGATAGATQVHLVARSALRPRPAALVVRLALVALVLVLAARAGHLVAGFAAWAAAFAAGFALVLRRLR